MAFHKQSFAARFGTMGDTAEGVFDLVYPESHPLGLNRPSFSMRGMTAAHRYTPDRLNQHGVFECMGIGRDGILKIKDEKQAALRKWTLLGPTHLFVYDQKNSTYYVAEWEEWQRALNAHGNPDSFHDGKTYTALAIENFPCDPQEIPQP